MEGKKTKKTVSGLFYDPNLSDESVSLKIGGMSQHLPTSKCDMNAPRDIVVEYDYITY
jgi:hypothetical protein